MVGLGNNDSVAGMLVNRIRSWGTRRNRCRLASEDSAMTKWAYIKELRWRWVNVLTDNGKISKRTKELGYWCEGKWHAVPTEDETQPVVTLPPLKTGWPDQEIMFHTTKKDG